MYITKASVFGLTALVASTQAAITITSPAADADINPTQQFSISWTSAPGDPEFIDITLECPSDQICTAQYIQVAENVRTSDGSYTVLPNTVEELGDRVVAIRDNGSIIATSGEITLTTEDASTMSILTETTTGTVTGEMTATFISGTSSDDNGSFTLSGTVSPSGTATTTTETESVTTPPSGTTQSQSSSPAPTSTPNAQPRVGGNGNGMVLTVAGVLAGFVALVA